MDANEVTKEIKLKESFKKTNLYKYGLIYSNKPVKKDYMNIKSFADLGVNRRNYVHKIATGRGGQSLVLNGKQQAPIVAEETGIDIPVKNIERNIIQSAIARNPFFTFQSISRYFPNLKSINDFIDSDNYLGGLEITFQGNVYSLEENKEEKLIAMLDLLGKIETEVRLLNTNEFEGSKDFHPSRIHDIFKDKSLKFSNNNERLNDSDQFEKFISTKEWFSFDTLYGTSEEKAFVRMLDRQIEKYKKQYNDIYLIRNEGHFAIYNFSDGQAFQPDFVLFLKEKDGQSIIYQLFIEPKGEFLADKDRWKENFLKEIKKEFGNKLLKLGEESGYRLIGVPFYNNEDENTFRETLDLALRV